MAETLTEAPKTKVKRFVKARPPEAKDPVSSFFAKMASYSQEDWGARVKVYLYRVEPVIDRTRSGEKKYIMSYAEAINEERILADHGSGRYKAILNFQKPGAEQGNEVDSVYIDIMNLSYPPRIALGDWVDDPRNKKWSWAKSILDKQQNPVASQSTDNLVETMRAVSDIQDAAVERSRANAPAPVDPLAIVRGVMDLMPKPAPSSEIPMFQALMTTMAQQSAQQTQILMAQIASSQSESKDLRAEMREMRQNPQQQTGGLSFVKELIGEVKTILPDLKEFFPMGESRPRNTPWWVGTLEKAMEGIAPAVPMIVGQLMANANAKRAAEPTPQRPMMAPGVAAPAATPQGPPVTTGPNIDLDGPMLSMLDAGRNGDDLAEMINTAFGDDGRRLYKGLIGMGEAGLIQLIQSRPIWDRLGPHQAKIPQFVKEFIDYDSPGEDGAPDAIDAEVEVI